MTFLLNRQKDDEAFLVFEFCRNIQKLIGISKAASTIKLEYNGDLTDQQLEYIGKFKAKEEEKRFQTGFLVFSTMG